MNVWLSSSGVKVTARNQYSTDLGRATELLFEAGTECVSISCEGSEERRRMGRQLLVAALDMLFLPLDATAEELAEEVRYQIARYKEETL